MVLRSYAKINLTLKVNSKRQDKLHEIQSFFCLISLKDKIVLKKVKQQRDKIIFKGPFANFVNKSNNSVINLFKILRRHKLISSYYSVTVFKNIPRVLDIYSISLKYYWLYLNYLYQLIYFFYL